MEKRLTWRGIDVVTTGVSVGEALQASDFDLFFIGGGQDFEQEVLLPDLAAGKTAELKAAIEDGIPCWPSAAAIRCWAPTIRPGTASSATSPAPGSLHRGKPGADDRQLRFTCDELGVNVVGFENHSGKTYLGSGVKPMGKVLKGYGNNGADGTEGARYKNVFATYSHGCLLPKNPVLCDYILKTALERKYGACACRRSTILWSRTPTSIWKTACFAPTRRGRSPIDPKGHRLAAGGLFALFQGNLQGDPAPIGAYSPGSGRWCPLVILQGVLIPPDVRLVGLAHAAGAAGIPPLFPPGSW